MQITIDTANLTDLDKQVLALLSGGASVPTPAPAAKAAPAAKKAAAPKAEPKAEEPAEEPEEAADEAAGDDEVTLEDAKTLATKMVANGEAAKVKAALATVGAKKVSEVAEDKVAEFVAALG